MTSPTGLVLLTMGGPQTLNDVGPYLRRLFLNHEIMQLPMQRVVGPMVARMRTSHVRKLYSEIGGGSPLYQWTRQQADQLAAQLDRRSPETAPHRGYVAFRYTDPMTEEALRQMRADGVRRAVAFVQFPQYSCATSGASLNELWREASRLGLADAFDWTVIDRWPTHPSYVAALAETITEGLGGFAPDHRDDVLVLFSAHSLPAKAVNRGDPYPQEIGATVQAVMDRAGVPNRYQLTYQSKVGPMPWQGPNTVKAVEGLAARGFKRLLVVGVSFTADHIETLSEVDIELAETAHDAGITEFRRAPALNARPSFVKALADIAAEHLAAGRTCTSQYPLRCPACVNPDCRLIAGRPATAAIASTSASTTAPGAAAPAGRLAAT
jgi:ferrochelatase